MHNHCDHDDVSVKCHAFILHWSSLTIPYMEATCSTEGPHHKAASPQMHGVTDNSCSAGVDLLISVESQMIIVQLASVVSQMTTRGWTAAACACRCCCACWTWPPCVPFSPSAASSPSAPSACGCAPSPVSIPPIPPHVQMQRDCRHVTISNTQLNKQLRSS